MSANQREPRPRPTSTQSYEGVFDRFVSTRSGKTGLEEVMRWTRRLAPGSAILDLGCGHGRPLGEGLTRAGFRVYGVDSSPKMVAAFRKRLPKAVVECAAIQTSAFFGRTFDAVVAWGILFFLPRVDQERVLGRVGQALGPGGSLFFTAPRSEVEWEDTFAGQVFSCVSLGARRYRETLTRHGLTLVEQRTDRWENDYYIAEKAPRALSRLAVRDSR